MTKLHLEFSIHYLFLSLMSDSMWVLWSDFKVELISRILQAMKVMFILRTVPLVQFMREANLPFTPHDYNFWLIYYFQYFKPSQYQVRGLD